MERKKDSVKTLKEEVKKEMEKVPYAQPRWNGESQIEFALRVHLEIGIYFWTLIPSLNLNFNSHEVELEWLCFGIYFGIIRATP